MRKYMSQGLGHLNRERIAKQALRRIIVERFKFDRTIDTEVTDEYIGDITDERTKKLYDLAVALTFRNVLSVPRAAGGEAQWSAGVATRENKPSYTAALVSGVSLVQMNGVSYDDGPEMLLVWGADDEDRLPNLGEMPMFLCVLASYGSAGTEKGLTEMMDASRTLGYKLSISPKARADVSVQGAPGGAVTVFRVLYEGLRKQPGSKLVGGYVGR